MSNPEWEAKYQKMMHYHSTDGEEVREGVTEVAKNLFKGFGLLALAALDLDEDPQTYQMRRIADRLDEMGR